MIQSLRSPTWQADSLPAVPPGKPKNTGVDSLFLLQHIFPTQEPNQGLLHCRQILYQKSYQGSTHVIIDLSKAIEGTPPTANPKANYRLWLILMCECRFFNRNEEDLRGRGGTEVDFSTPSAQLCCEPKIARKTI